MKILRILLFIIILSPLGGSMVAQDSPEEIVEEFFDIYREESISRAIDFFFPSNRWTDNIQEELENLKSKCENYFSEGYSGKYYGYEVIDTQEFGKHYRKITCLVRFDRQPFRFVFVLYRPNDRWKGQNFFFSDEVEESDG